MNWSGGERSNRGLIQGIIVAICLEVLHKTTKNLGKIVVLSEVQTESSPEAVQKPYRFSAFAGTDTAEKLSAIGPIHVYLKLL